MRRRGFKAWAENLQSPNYSDATFRRILAPCAFSGLDADHPVGAAETVNLLSVAGRYFLGVAGGALVAGFAAFAASSGGNRNSVRRIARSSGLNRPSFGSSRRFNTSCSVSSTGRRPIRASLPLILP